jgi:hypothetical protein
MKHHHINNDDYEIVNGRKVLKDGRVYRAKMTLMDSGHRVSHRPVFARVTDATGDPLGLHKPGWRVPAQDARDPLARHVVTDAARQAVLDARQHYLDELTSAWKHPPGLRDIDRITGAGTHNVRGMKPGDPCSASDAGKEDVVPDAPKASANDAMPVDDIETAYRLYAEEISQAWRTPR